MPWNCLDARSGDLWRERHIKQIDAQMPWKLLIYYGAPKSIQQTNTNCGAAQVVQNWDVVIWGSNIEVNTTGNTNYEDAIEIMSLSHVAKPGMQFFGYVDLGMTTNSYTQAEVNTRISWWAGMGVDGLFVDDAGIDYGVNRTRLNDTLDYIHQNSKRAFINAWNPDDVFAATATTSYNPTSAATHIGSWDYYLSESFIAATEVYSHDMQTLYGTWEFKHEKLIAYRRQTGCKIYGAATVELLTHSGTYLDYLEKFVGNAALVLGLDGYGIMQAGYSASGSGNTYVRFPNWIDKFAEKYQPNPTFLYNTGSLSLTRRDGGGSITMTHSVPFFDYSTRDPMDYFHTGSEGKSLYCHVGCYQAYRVDSNGIMTFVQSVSMGHITANSGANIKNVLDVTSSVQAVQPYFYVAKNAAQTISINTWTTIQWDVESADIGGIFNINSDYFQASLTGVFLFSVSIRLTGNTNNGHAQLMLEKNNASPGTSPATQLQRYDIDYFPNAVDIALSGGGVFFLNSGDYVHLSVYHDCTGTVQVYGSIPESWWSGIYLGKVG